LDCRSSRQQSEAQRTDAGTGGRRFHALTDLVVLSWRRTQPHSRREPLSAQKPGLARTISPHRRSGKGIDWPKVTIPAKARGGFPYVELDDGSITGGIHD
jgi:hypothetical protein